MTINKKDYEDLQPYWDYQRQVQFNKEAVMHIAEKIYNSGKIVSPLGPMSLEEMKEHMWSKCRSEDFEETPKGWVPQDEKLRFDWEPDPNAPKQISQPKGRPVVLRAKNYDNNIG